MKKLKLFFACLLMAVLSIGQVWAEDEVYKTALFGSSYNANNSSYTSSFDATNGTFVVTATNFNNNNNGWTNATSGLGQIKCGRKNNASVGTITTKAAIDKAVTKVDVTVDAFTSGKVNSFKLYVATDDAFTEDLQTITVTIATGINTFTVETPTANCYYKVEIDCASGSSNGLVTVSKVEYYVEKEETSDPAVSADPASVADVAMEGVTNQTIDLTYENITDYETEVSVHPNADGTGTLSPAWLSASVSDADDYATVTYSVSANDGAARTAYIKVYTTDGDKEATTIIPVSQVKYEAPFDGETLEIAGSDFNTTSYNANNGDHTKNCVVYNTTAVMKNGSDIQFQKTNGVMYNKTDLSEIAKIEITKTGDYNLSVYEGTTEQPTTEVTASISGNVYTYSFNSGKGYFKIKCGSTSLSKVTPIKVYYTPAAHAVTLSAGSNGTLGATVDAAAIASGDNVDMCKTVTITATPDAGYKLKSLTVTDADDNEVEVTSNQFVMPSKAVTIAAEFEATKTLTSIALSGEYPTVFLTGDAFSHEGMTVTANYDDATYADVTSSATFTGYDMSSATEQTVTVSYTEGTTETQTYNITVKDAYTVTEILPLVPALNAGTLATRVKGYISQIDQYNSTYYSITYWISVDGATTSDQLEVYSGKNVGNTNFSAITDLEVGDFVTVSGEVKTHTNGVKEFDKNNYIITDGRIQKGAVTNVVVSGTATKTTYSADETFETAGLVVTATYENGFTGIVTEGITWGDNLTDHKVAATGNVAVTATVGGQTSAAYNVAVEVSAKTVSSIAAAPATYTIYTGETLPQPTITATYSEGDPADVSAEAIYDSENVFATNTTGEQTITVSYTFGENTVTTTYTVTVVDYANADDAPYTVTEALHIITAAIGNTESAREIVVAGTVSAEKVSNYKNRYKISDGVNELLVYNGKGFNEEAFTDNNYPKVGDVMVVKGNVINFNNNTPEFASGKSYPLSQIRPATIAIENVTSFEVGATDLTENDLVITTASDGDITFVSGDETKATIVANAIHAVAPGTVTITANLAATENVDKLNYAAATTTFDVTVIAAPTKYTITFDGNGADGGTAPAAIADKAEGASVTLPANTYAKTGYTFNGWKVYYVDGESVEHEVAVSEGAFTMPAFNVTIQAQWEEIPAEAYVYTSNVELTADSDNKCYSEGVTIETVDYDGLRIATGSAAGSATITVPAHTTKLHFHIAGWKDVSGSIDVNLGGSKLATITLIADDGINQSNGNKAPYALVNDPIGYYSYVAIPDSETPTEVEFSAGSGNRAVIFGVNQEGGVLPVLDHIAITGTMTNTTGWKTGDEITPEGLTVNAIYTLNNVEQTPVDVTSSVVWSHAALAEGQTEVTLTATYTEGDVERTANANVTIAAVETGDPTIITNPASYLNFGASVEKDAVVAPKTITVTLKNITSATATLGGTNYSAFSIDKTTGIVDGDIITVSVNTATPDTYAGTVTIKDDNSDTEKVINLSMTVVEPEVPETSVSTSSKWVAANEIVDGMNVLIVGVEEVESVKHYYAMGADRGNNRGVVEGTLNEGVLTPGDGTMSFTLVAQDGGTYALRASNGKYLYAGGTGNNNYLNTKAYTGDLDANAKWNIDLANSTIIATSSNRNEMRFNKSNNPKIISCYQSSNTSPTVALYVPQVVKYSVTYAANGGSGDAPAAVEYVEGETFTVAAADLFTAPEGKEFDMWNDGTTDYAPGASYTVGTSDVVLTAQWKDATPAPVLNYENIREGVTAGKYYTICLSKKVVAFRGGSFWTLNKRSTDFAYLEEVTGVLPAGTPYIFSVNTGEQLEVVYEGEAATEALANGALRGTFTDLVQEHIDGIALNAQSDIYLLSDNTLWNVSKDGSSNNKILAGRAYIVFNDLTLVTEAPQPAPGRRVVAMPMHKDNATGIDAVNMNMEGVQKVVVDGHMYIVRDGKMFDATGRLVK